MLDFIWHLRDSVALEHGAANEAALDSLERLLDQQRKGVRKRAPGVISFIDPLWRRPMGPSWLAMVFYDQGRFWIEQGLSGRRLYYDLRSLHGMIFCLFSALMFFFFGLAPGGFAGGLTCAVGIFAWMYGMNVLLALFRVPRAIRKAVRYG